MLSNALTATLIILYLLLHTCRDLVNESSSSPSSCSWCSISSHKNSSLLRCMPLKTNLLRISSTKFCSISTCWIGTCGKSGRKFSNRKSGWTCTGDKRAGRSPGRSPSSSSVPNWTCAWGFTKWILLLIASSCEVLRIS